MNADRATLKLVLDGAGILLSLDTFSQRFNIQKRIYLIQIAGCDLGYRFAWLPRGPSSRRLTEEAFTLGEEVASGCGDVYGDKLSAAKAEQIEKARELWASPADLPACTDDWLELLASLHYLKHIAYWPKGSTRDFPAVFAALVETKPQFRDAEAAARWAWERLGEFGLLENKTLAYARMY
jgi:hypothetical protein